MKKIAGTIIVLLSLTSLPSFAQTNANRYFVTLKGLPAPEKNGNLQSVFTTSDYIARNPKLIFSIPNTFEILEFTASIIVDTQYWGPYIIKGNALTQEVINRIKQTKGPGSRLFFENIKALGPDSMVRILGSMMLKYDQ